MFLNTDCLVWVVLMDDVERRFRGRKAGGRRARADVKELVSGSYDVNGKRLRKMKRVRGGGGGTSGDGSGVGGKGVRTLSERATRSLLFGSGGTGTAGIWGGVIALGVLLVSFRYYDSVAKRKKRREKKLREMREKVAELREDLRVVNVAIRATKKEDAAEEMANYLRVRDEKNAELKKAQEIVRYLKKELGVGSDSDSDSGSESDSGPGSEQKKKAKQDAEFMAWMRIDPDINKRAIGRVFYDGKRGGGWDSGKVVAGDGGGGVGSHAARNYQLSRVQKRAEQAVVEAQINLMDIRSQQKKFLETQYDRLLSLFVSREIFDGVLRSLVTTRRQSIDSELDEKRQIVLDVGDKLVKIGFEAESVRKRLGDAIAVEAEVVRKRAETGAERLRLQDKVFMAKAREDDLRARVEELEVQENVVKRANEAGDDGGGGDGGGLEDVSESARKAEERIRQAREAAEAEAEAANALWLDLEKKLEQEKVEFDRLVEEEKRVVAARVELEAEEKRKEEEEARLREERERENAALVADEAAAKTDVQNLDAFKEQALDGGELEKELVAQGDGGFSAGVGKAFASVWGVWRGGGGSGGSGGSDSSAADTEPQTQVVESEGVQNKRGGTKKKRRGTPAPVSSGVAGKGWIATAVDLLSGPSGRAVDRPGGFAVRADLGQDGAGGAAAEVLEVLELHAEASELEKKEGDAVAALDEAVSQLESVQKNGADLREAGKGVVGGSDGGGGVLKSLHGFLGKVGELLQLDQLDDEYGDITSFWPYFEEILESNVPEFQDMKPSSDLETRFPRKKYLSRENMVNFEKKLYFVFDLFESNYVVIRSLVNYVKKVHEGFESSDDADAGSTLIKRGGISDAAILWDMFFSLPGYVVGQDIDYLHEVRVILVDWCRFSHMDVGDFGLNSDNGGYIFQRMHLKYARVFEEKLLGFLRSFTVVRLERFTLKEGFYSETVQLGPREFDFRHWVKEWVCPVILAEKINFEHSSAESRHYRFRGILNFLDLFFADDSIFKRPGFLYGDLYSESKRLREFWDHISMPRFEKTEFIFNEMAGWETFPFWDLGAVISLLVRHFVWGGSNRRNFLRDAVKVEKFLLHSFQLANPLEEMSFQFEHLSGDLRGIQYEGIMNVNSLADWSVSGSVN